jgi:Na+/H+ antiporter NhaC
MFDEFNGLPLHPLAVHAVVALIPLSGLLGVLFAVPRTRAWARWPLPLVAVVAALATFVARESGEALRAVGGQNAAGLGGPVADLIDEHQQASTVLFVLVIAYAALAVVALTGVPAHGLAAVLVVVALLMSFWSYRVGDLGARAVWNPADSVDYSS